MKPRKIAHTKLSQGTSIETQIWCASALIRTKVSKRILRKCMFSFEWGRTEDLNRRKSIRLQYGRETWNDLFQACLCNDLFEQMQIDVKLHVWSEVSSFRVLHDSVDRVFARTEISSSVLHDTSVSTDYRRDQAAAANEGTLRQTLDWLKPENSFVQSLSDEWLLFQATFLQRRDWMIPVQFSPPVAVVRSQSLLNDQLGFLNPGL